MNFIFQITQHHHHQEQHYTRKPPVYELRQYENYNNYNHNYSSNIVLNYNNNNFFPPLEKPSVKMQREEIIIEHSQLVLNVNTNQNNIHRSHHYTQVNLI